MGSRKSREHMSGVNRIEIRRKGRERKKEGRKEGREGKECWPKEG